MRHLQHRNFKIKVHQKLNKEGKTPQSLKWVFKNGNLLTICLFLLLLIATDEIQDHQSISGLWGESHVAHAGSQFDDSRRPTLSISTRCRRVDVTVSVQWTSAPVTRFYCFCIRQNKCDKNKSTTRTDSPERDEPRVRASGETFISDTVPDQTPRREEFPWIETQERRERTTARGRATAPNLNKTNEYITGLFYLSPNGFTS